MSKKEEKDYIKDGVLCSFPYHLELHKSEGAVEGEEVSYIYCDLKFNDEEKKAIEKELADIFTAEGAGFYLEGTEINYRIKAAGNPKENDMDNEVNLRRNFIENYLEAEDELDALVLKYHGKTKKTEFTKF
jgi:hypothetical protein